MPQGMLQRTSKRATRIADLRKRATELRIRGAAYEQIAEQLGVSVGSAWNHVAAALVLNREQAAENAERVREIELRRLDRYLVKLDAAIDGARVRELGLIGARRGCGREARAQEGRGHPAIQQVSTNASEQFQRSEFTERVADSQRKADAADRKARELEQDATARQRRWEELVLKAPPAKG